MATKKHDLVKRWQSEDGQERQRRVIEALKSRKPAADIATILGGLEHAAEVAGLDLRGLRMNGEWFGLELDRPDFSYCWAEKGSHEPNPFILFKRCTLRNAKFIDIKSELAIEVSDITGSDLSGANLRRNFFGNSKLQNCRFDRANLASANFSGQDLTGCSFVGANLTYASLSDANCEGVDFTGAKLQGAVLDRIRISPTTKLNQTAGEAQTVTTEMRSIARDLVAQALAEIKGGAAIKPAFHHFLEEARQRAEDERYDLFADIANRFSTSDVKELTEFLEHAARGMSAG